MLCYIGIARVKHILLVCVTNHYVLLCKCHLVRLDWAICIESYLLLHVYLKVHMVTMVTLNILVFLFLLMLMIMVKAV